AGGMQQRVTDRRVGIVERANRLRSVDDATSGGEAFEAEAFSVPEQRGRSGAVDVEDEAGTGHDYRRLSERRSKTILTAPRRPAAAACSMASAKRSSG